MDQELSRANVELLSLFRAHNIDVEPGLFDFINFEYHSPNAVNPVRVEDIEVLRVGDHCLTFWDRNWIVLFREDIDWHIEKSFRSSLPGAVIYFFGEVVKDFIFADVHRRMED